MPGGFDGVVLMGPPGSGKSYLGAALRDAGVARYEEIEPLLVARFGTGAAFAGRKDEALAFIREQYERLLDVPGLPVVIESTGVSDRPMIEAFSERYRLAFVAVDTRRDVCIERVRTRGTCANLSNDVEATGRFHDYWHAEVAPSYAFEVRISGVDAVGAVGVVRGLLARRRASL